MSSGEYNVDKTLDEAKNAWRSNLLNKNSESEIENLEVMKALIKELES